MHTPLVSFSLVRLLLPPPQSYCISAHSFFLSHLSNVPVCLLWFFFSSGRRSIARLPCSSYKSRGREMERKNIVYCQYNLVNKFFIECRLWTKHMHVQCNSSISLEAVCFTMVAPSIATKTIASAHLLPFDAHSNPSFFGNRKGVVLKSCCSTIITLIFICLMPKSIYFWIWLVLYGCVAHRAPGKASLRNIYYHFFFICSAVVLQSSLLQSWQ